MSDTDTPLPAETWSCLKTMHLACEGCEAGWNKVESTRGAALIVEADTPKGALELAQRITALLNSDRSSSAELLRLKEERDRMAEMLKVAEECIDDFACNRPVAIMMPVTHAGKARRKISAMKGQPCPD